MRHPRHEEVIEQIRSAAAMDLGLRLRGVQIDAGTQLLNRSIAEMQTGEGKTLTTVIGAALLTTQIPEEATRSAKRIRSTPQILVATANDYLAARDANWMRPIYERLGLRVGNVTSDASDPLRRDAYGSDVVYGTVRQFAFDFLRDSSSRRGQSSDPCRGLFSFDALMVDEADSVLIDERGPR